MDFFERNTYTVQEGTNKLIKKFIEQHPSLYDNPSHFVRCAIIKQFREERKKGRFISEAIK